MEPEGFGLATVDPKEKKYAELKMSGYIKLREKDMYALRLRIPMGNLLADQMPRVAEVARKYGRGYVGLTVRQGVEIPWIHFRDLEKARAELEEAGIILSGCGPRVRAVVSCKGTICPYGIIDTHAIGMRIDERFFSPRVLPHKYKIGIAGCPNSCSKPQFNDLGLMGQVEPRLEESLCNGCSLCEVNCADAAITMSGDLPVRDPQKCVYCGDCIRVCPTDAWVQRAVGVAVFAGGK
ncbi:MAG: 4Fe-4S binding protein, partial [Actinobacteria bacterium]|nr:4Fe-4S binding protein [Actinomycetota bacterium]